MAQLNECVVLSVTEDGRLGDNKAPGLDDIEGHVENVCAACVVRRRTTGRGKFKKYAESGESHLQQIVTLEDE